MDPYIVQLLHLRLRDHCERDGGKIIGARAIVAPRNVKVSPTWLPTTTDIVMWREKEARRPQP